MIPNFGHQFSTLARDNHINRIISRVNLHHIRERNHIQKLFMYNAYYGIYCVASSVIVLKTHVI